LKPPLPLALRLASGLALALVPRAARACPCSDDAGGSALVRQDERYAASLVATSRHALGHFDAFGRYSALGSAEAETSEELLLRAGLRLPRRVEWLGELGYASYRFHAPQEVEQRTGVGDALVRVRVTLRDEGMPHESPWLPALALSGLLRAPLGSLARDRTTSFGSGGAQLGLGAWELGGGLEASRSILPKLEVLVGAEGAYRFEDHVLGRARRLGPRVDATLGARVLPSAWFASSVALRARMTADVTLGAGAEGADRRLDGTAERLWSIVLGAAVYDQKSKLRSSLTLSVDPPLGSFSVGSTAAAALSVGLGYGAMVSQ
jgi:hypothetical protein